MSFTLALLKMNNLKNTTDDMIHNATLLFGLWYMEDFMGLVGLKNIYSLNLTFALCCWLGMSQLQSFLLLKYDNSRTNTVNGPVTPVLNGCSNEKNYKICYFGMKCN